MKDEKRVEMKEEHSAWVTVTTTDSARPSKTSAGNQKSDTEDTNIPTMIANENPTSPTITTSYDLTQPIGTGKHEGSEQIAN